MVAKVSAALAAITGPGERAMVSEAGAPYQAGERPTLAEVHRDLIEIRDLLRGLLLIGEQGRLPAVLKAKAKGRAGGAA